MTRPPNLADDAKKLRDLREQGHQSNCVCQQCAALRARLLLSPKWWRVVYDG